MMSATAFAQTPWKPATQAAVPEPAREFRGLWVASVANIDWPSRRDLTTAQQLEEMHRIIDAAAATNINVLLLQVRTSCDALYESATTPWSEYLTGQSGKAPDPAYDPLKTWIDECHAKGIELHAWFNPFRARHFEARKPDAPTHVSNAHPELVVEYDRYKWMDPGADESQRLALDAITDVVKRYDVDGVHIDDYFYPYPDNKSPFPDDARFNAYRTQGGKLDWQDWRRDRINTFVKRMYESVKELKPHVKVGISPFGIWRPGFPPGVEGFDAWAKLSADSRLWLQEGWMDYCTPQLYWAISAPKQSFAALLDWWILQNAKGRLIIPGLNTSKLDAVGKWPVEEIPNQIGLVRTRPTTSGTIQFSAKAIVKNYKGIQPALATGAFIEPAVTPIFPTCGDAAPGPLADVSATLDGQVHVTWTPPAHERFVVIGVRRAGAWHWRMVSAAAGGAGVDATDATTIAVAPLGRNGRLGPWSALQP